MITKIILSLSLVGMMNCGLKKNFKLISNINPSSESNYVVSQYEYKGTQNILSVNDFELGYLGENQTQNINFSYQLKNTNFNFYCTFLYTDLNGEKVGYKKLHEKGKFKKNQVIYATLEIEKNLLPRDSVLFEFNLEGNRYNSDGSLSKNGSINIDFELYNREAYVKATSVSPKVFYYYKFNSILLEGYRYYDSLTFASYSKTNKHEIYFRIKPEDFIFEYHNVFNSQIVKFYILNEAGSFIDCTDIDSVGRYFLMDINYEEDNECTLSYKSINRGGTKNLYLDPLSMYMYSNKSSKLYEVKNIYLPRKSSESYKRLKVMPTFVNFGSNFVNLMIPFTINFDIHYVENYFYTSARICDIGNDSSGEEIIP